MQNELFKKQYRIPSARLVEYDYSQPGFYFVTICTKDKKFYFGKIVDYEMALNDIGRQAAACWLTIPEHFPHVQLDEFVIMPNHVHGIIYITENVSPVETQNFASLQPDNREHQNRFGPQSKNLASIIRGFKIGVTKLAIQNHTQFAWQPRFYDHIIRTEKSLQGVRWYIHTNPARWERDRNNPEGIMM